MTKIIDTHAHYDDERFDNDRDGLLMGMKEQGVDIIVKAYGIQAKGFDTVYEAWAAYQAQA